MLRRIALTVVAVAGVAVFLSTSADATDNSKFLTAVGKEVRVGVEVGEVTCIGGEPTGQHFPNPICSPGTKRILIRGEVDYNRLTDVSGTAAELFQQGTNRIIVNCNMDALLAGQCWGTFEITVPNQGVWQGSWQGTFDLMNFVAVFSAVGQGSGGHLEGLHMKYEAILPGNTPYASFSVRVDGK